MNTFPDNLQELINRAADLRAGGHSWDGVARLLDLPIEECRDWPRSHARAWTRAYLVALRRKELEVGVEAREILRRLLTSEEESIQLIAARLLLPKPRPRRTGTRAVAEGDRELADFITHVRGLCDEELANIERELGVPDVAQGAAADQPGEVRSE